MSYHAQDMDREAVINQQEMDDAVADYHRDVFTEPPDKCSAMCAWLDPFGHCINWQTWPDCRLMKELR